MPNLKVIDSDWWGTSCGNHDWRRGGRYAAGERGAGREVRQGRCTWRHGWRDPTRAFFDPSYRRGDHHPGDGAGNAINRSGASSACRTRTLGGGGDVCWRLRLHVGGARIHSAPFRSRSRRRCRSDAFVKSSGPATSASSATRTIAAGIQRHGGCEGATNHCGFTTDQCGCKGSIRGAQEAIAQAG